MAQFSVVYLPDLLPLIRLISAPGAQKKRSNAWAAEVCRSRGHFEKISTSDKVLNVVWRKGKLFLNSLQMWRGNQQDKRFRKKLKAIVMMKGKGIGIRILWNRLKKQNLVSFENRDEWIIYFDENVGDSVTDNIDQERGVSECSCPTALLSQTPPSNLDMLKGRLQPRNKCCPSI